MSLPHSSSTPATDAGKLDECRRAGEAVRHLLEKNIRPSDIMTRAAFENAMVIVSALGGSTNAVLHLIAMARAVGVDLSIDDFQTVSDRIPFLADVKPSGRYVMEDLHRVGGVPAVMKYLLEADLLDGNVLTVTGKTIAENLADVAPVGPEQDVIMPLDGSSRVHWRQAVLWPRLRARKACSSKVRRACSMPRKTCCGRWRTERS